MKVPKAKKLPSGAWHIQLRLGGQSVSITKPTEKECVKAAQAVKAQYLLDKKTPAVQVGGRTTSEAIDAWIAEKKNVLSPSSIRSYRNIQKNRFSSIMDRQISKIQPSEWQRIVNEECAHFAPKTVATAWGFIRSIVHYETGQFPPSVKLAAPVRSQKAFLQPEEIKPFVAAAAETRYAIPLLLALSSLRISEIAALRWEDIRIDDDFIYVRGAVVQDENHKWVAKKTNKNLSSSRNVPIFIPELKNALVNGKKESGPVMEIRQCTLLRALHKICAENDLTDVTVHGLRHSFASLGYHLGLPEEIIMEIGGWHDLTTMKKIYTHIAQSDRTRYHNEMRSFYKNAYENAHE